MAVALLLRLCAGGATVVGLYILAVFPLIAPNVLSFLRRAVAPPASYRIEGAKKESGEQRGGYP
jgi:hypothetical protein